MPDAPPEVKGLLPGRGPAGRGPGRAAGLAGAGRGAAGRAGASPAGAGEENSAAGRARPERPAKPDGRPGADPGRRTGGLRRSRARGGRGVVGRGPASRSDAGRGWGTRLGCSRTGTAGRLGAAGFRGPGFAEDAPPDGGVAPKASVNLRTTGASIVEDADRTNSPSSVSLAMTALLSKPSSLASSYTRTLATSLLSIRPGYSSAGLSLLHGRTHRVLIECSSQSRPTSISRGT
ncbi:hypothetical protein KCH_53010 [Kitasatospora cheerisanensis KCTC 2395]|uniref:Uncharacterized protein n=1 Tax=Kitasatospora cheerisanensis KCTC 2395 TaxID=1348663 RepID=A0A066YXX1_9ACTN|nr:hypothetical protein KCH_53010 [Kitasatospora cheerisanensis KCTC 2395]